ncbi:MAG: hypothetical protein ACLUPE_13815 [Turicibacter sanguinis]|uniref:hypothetical protein n=1 Tax=Turicibacter sanguinis TaxID=154288 RepID=UPI0039924477
MNIKTIQVVILNHKTSSIEKFARNAKAIQYYQDGESANLVNDLYHHWFGINEACIVAHHLASLSDNQEEINYVVAVNPFKAGVSYDVQKINGRRLRFVFIFFEVQESEARQYVYEYLKDLLLSNKTQPVEVDVDYHNVNFY